MADKFKPGDAIEVITSIEAFGRGNDIKGYKGFIDDIVYTKRFPDGRLKVSITQPIDLGVIYLKFSDVAHAELDIDDYISYIQTITTRVLLLKNEADRLRNVYRNVDFQKRQLLRKDPKYGIKVK